MEQLESEMEKKKRREELETIAADVLVEIIENIVGKIEAEERENATFIKELITKEIIDKVQDKVTEDFKNFIIDELFKRIASRPRFESDYEDVTYEANSDLFEQNFLDDVELADLNGDHEVEAAEEGQQID